MVSFVFKIHIVDQPSLAWGSIIYFHIIITCLNNPAKNTPLSILRPPAWKPASCIVAPLHQVPIARPLLDTLVRKLISLEVSNHWAHQLLVGGVKQVQVLREGRRDSGRESKYVDKGNLGRRVIITQGIRSVSRIYYSDFRKCGLNKQMQYF